ncbi:MAG: serine acetyltransferase [Planctomycetota bacterium]
MADNNQVTKLTNKIANDIVESLTFPDQRGQAAPIPEFASLVDMIHRLKAIVYPGFRSNENSSEKVFSDLTRQLAEAHEILSRQIAIAVARHFEACEDLASSSCAVAVATCRDEKRPEDIAQYSHDIASKYIERMPAIRDSLMTDVEAAFLGDPACRNFDEVLLCYPGLSAVTVYRLAHELHRFDVPFLPRMMTEWVHGETGVDIHPGATIGDYFFIDHGTGVVIGETCEIGNHVKIYQGVTLGALSFPQDETGQLVRNTKRHPTIEDNVVIYANATVLGGKTVVGKDSVVGSSVWLTSSVEAGTTVTMEKPKLRMRNQVGKDA